MIVLRYGVNTAIVSSKRYRKVLHLRGQGWTWRRNMLIVAALNSLCAQLKQAGDVWQRDAKSKHWAGEQFCFRFYISVIFPREDKCHGPDGQILFLIAVFGKGSTKQGGQQHWINPWITSYTGSAEQSDLFSLQTRLFISLLFFGLNAC